MFKNVVKMLRKGGKKEWRGEQLNRFYLGQVGVSPPSISR